MCHVNKTFASKHYLVKLFRNQVEIMVAHARSALPHECCGLLGGRDDLPISVYQLKNVAENSLVEYEAATTDLFEAQRAMRQRGEKLLGIYHSHPRQSEPVPSSSDVRRAFYRDAVYFIIGFLNDKAILRAFRLYETEQRWEPADFAVID